MAHTDAVVQYLVWRAGRLDGAPAPAIKRIAKLLYLVDVISRERTDGPASDVRWYFNHYGPWSRDVRDCVDRLVADGAIRARKATGQADQIFSTDEPPDLEAFSPELQAVLDDVVNRWAAAGIDELTRYTYENTSPMRGAVRNRELSMSHAHLIDDASALAEFDPWVGHDPRDIVAWLTAVGQGMTDSPPMHEDGDVERDAAADMEDDDDGHGLRCDGHAYTLLGPSWPMTRPDETED